MAKQTINIGTAPNDGTGTPLRTSFDYCNQNFTELYTAVGPSGNNIVVPGTATISGDLTVDTSTLKVDSSNDRVGIGTATPAAKLIVRDGTNRNLLVSSDATQLGSAGIAIGGFTDNAAGYAPLSLLASSMQFGIGGSTAMTLNSTGLGVGVTPSVRLHVSTTSLIAARLESTSASNACLIDLKDASTTATAKVMVGSKGDALQLYSGGNVSATLDANSNVGVGVTPSAWNSSFRGIDISAGGAIAGSSDSVRLFSNSAFNTAGNNVYKNAATAGRYDIQGNVHTWNISTNTPSVGGTITFSPAMTLDASGRLLVGTVTSGTAAGDGVVKLGGYGHCISQTGTSIASGSSIDLTVVTSGAGYQGFLSVANTQMASANTRTQTTYSVFGRGTASTITQIATANGSLGGASFTVTTPSNGVIRITNTSGAAASISAQFFGGASA
jgi:hypothetical protein